MPLRPTVYAALLAQKVEEQHAQLWMVNTGWTGGPYGEGSRMKLSYTRAMVRAAINGELDDVPTTVDPVFGFAIPNEVPGVPSEILMPRSTWRDPKAYDARASDLVERFKKYMQQFESYMSEEVKAAAPKAPTA
jgi:phosphoenolpyruvate carboxykinase (ATP)